MTAQKYIRAIQALMREQQQVQMCCPPSSIQWQNASAELHRLGAILNEELTKGAHNNGMEKRI